MNDEYRPQVVAHVQKNEQRLFPSYISKIISILKKPLVLIPVLMIVLGITAWFYFPPFMQISYSVANTASFAAQNTPDKVQVNTANAAELAVLPNIGDVTAQAIVDYRKQNGDFKQMSDLLNVKGIGQKTLDKIQDLIIL